MPGGSLRAALGDTLLMINWLVRVRIARQVADGMRHLHSLSFVHRDLKSDNVLLDDVLNAKVADFGTSRVLGTIAPTTRTNEARTTTPGNHGNAFMTRAVGTQLWMAPEVFFGQSTYGPEVDVYSFGIIMWELITRKDPWDELGATSYITQSRLLDEALVAGRRPTIPKGFANDHEVYTTTMQRCWATEPESRPSFESVVFSLSMVPCAAPTSPPVSPSTPAARPAPRGAFATTGGSSGYEGSSTLIYE